MNIEDQIFKKRTINFTKLIPYGFRKENKKYTISKNILDNNFQITVTITEDKVVKGRIDDLSFDEEYTNYRIESQNTPFVNQIRTEFTNFLIDIRDNCTTENYFTFPQTNRLAQLIIDKYHDLPEFPWDKPNDAGIFRNPDNQKWYGLIMNISRDKLDNQSGEVEILNVKLTEEEILKLLNKKGFYRAYHMNKKNWITIVLDDTLKDEEIMTYIEKSHALITTIDKWLIPANPKYYDCINCFNDTDTITWKQSSNIKVGDLVYMYVASPYSSILYKCRVIEANIPYSYQDKNITISKIMKIKLLARYKPNEYPFEKIKTYGIKWIRGPRRMPSKLLEVMEKEKTNN